MTVNYSLFPLFTSKVRGKYEDKNNKIDKDNINSDLIIDAVNIIKNSGLVAFPTENRIWTWCKWI